MTRNRATELGGAGLPRNRAAELENWEGLGYN